MALTFTQTNETRDGLAVTDAYGRIGVTDYLMGTDLQITVAPFASETAFTSGKVNITLMHTVDGVSRPLPTTFVMPYDRATDGTDILQLAHDYAQFKYDSMGITTTINL